MSRPLIGICSRWNDEKTQFVLDRRDADMVTQAGGCPVILPFDFDRMDALDGIIFTGGGDVNHLLGGYEDGPIVHYDDPHRDEAEIRHCQTAVALGLPILAICRGYQLVNCVLGGCLIRDIAEAGYTTHSDQRADERYQAHTIITEPGTIMRSLFGERHRVLSLHHQAVLVPGEGLTVNARTQDGLIEGYEDVARHILGMQTHPEMMPYLPPYTWLLGEARAYQEKRK